MNQTYKIASYLVQIDHMDALFEAQFSPLAESGRALSKCGKCLRYMKFISSQPQRLYCGICEEVYYLPQKGTIKVNIPQNSASTFQWLRKLFSFLVSCSIYSLWRYFLKDVPSFFFKGYGNCITVWVTLSTNSSISYI